MRKTYLLNLILLSFTFNLYSCSGKAHTISCAEPKTPRKVTPITGYKLTSDSTDESQCKDFLTRWEDIKTQLKANNIIGERLEVDYNHYDFYKVTISENASSIEKYKELITSLTKGMDYEIVPFKDEGLKNTCQSIQPAQRKCPNCKDDILAINVTDYSRHGCSPAYCDISITFCVDGETYSSAHRSGNWDQDKTRVSDLIKPECIEGLAIKDGAIVFPKSVLECVNKSEDIDQLCFSHPLTRWTNPNSSSYYNPSESKKENPTNDETITSSEETPSSSKEPSSNETKRRVSLPPEYTKLKLQYIDSCKLHQDSYPVQDYIPKSIDSFLKITPNECSRFSCNFE